MDPDDHEFNLPTRQPACDACRRRKVRCDKLSPCSSCKASHLPCRTTRATTGRRPRIQTSSNRHEQTLAQLQTKVDQLSQSLKPRVESTNAIGSAGRASSAATDAHSAPSRRQSPHVERDNAFEGDSSFMTHSKQATQAFKASLAATPQLNVDEALSDAVANLQQALESSHTQPSTPSYSAESTNENESHGLPSLPLPPSSLVLKLLKLAKVEHQRIFDEQPALDLPTVIGYCQKVFFAIEPYSIAAFIIVNTSLLFLLRGLTDQAKLEVQICRADWIHYLEVLPQNVDFAVRKLPLVAAHSIENITALHLACGLAVESSIQASAWDLNSTAARMALSAGLHRLGRRSSDNEQRIKRVTFWSIYAMDRSMALSFGRAPNIQDYDIQTDRLKLPEDTDSPTGPMLACWVDIAELQGQTYHQLYSAHAQNQPLDSKVAAAKQLAARCLELQRDFQVYSNSYNHFFEGLQVQEIGFQSLLAMIYRMIPPIESDHPLQFGRDCILSARAALKFHNEGWSKVGATGKISDDDWRVFVHWSTLFSPFVPFICVFGNVIAQCDLQDLALLGEFVSTLQSAAEQSHSIKKLHYACNSFHQIAKAFVARRSQHLHPSATGANSISTDWQSFDGTSGESSSQSLSDTLLSQQDWDSMLSEWDLGLGTLDARQMSSFLDLLPND